jgi:hypothetical protein
MRVIEIGDYSLGYLNMLIRRYQKGKLNKAQFLKFQATLYRWNMNYWEEEED